MIISVANNRIEGRTVRVRAWLIGIIITTSCFLYADQSGVSACNQELNRTLITHALASLAQETPSKNLPAIIDVLRKAAHAQQASGELAHGEMDYLEFFNDALKQALSAGVTRSARPTDSDTTGLSSRLPGMDQAIQAAVNNAIEFINRQGSWSVNRLVIRDKVMGNMSVSGTVLLGVEPTADNNATTKLYVDTVAQGLHVKGSCRALENTNDIALTGLPTIDGIALIADERALLNHQTDARQNGIWVVAAGAWTRPDDFAPGSNASSAFTFVQEGTIYADTGWVCTNNTGHAAVDTDDLTFTQFSGPGTYTMANVGTGAGQVYKEQVGGEFRLRTIAAGTNIDVTNNTSDITVATTDDINVVGDLTVNTDKFTVAGATGQTTLKGDDANLIIQDDTGTATCTIESATGNICSVGQIASSQATCSASDKRIKTDVKTLDPRQCLKTINQLRPVSFYFTQEWLKKNNLKNDQKHLGLIAQEVKQEIPEVVSQTKFPSGDRLYTIAYEQIIPHLISCIQELNNKIELLNKKLAYLEQ